MAAELLAQIRLHNTKERRIALTGGLGSFYWCDNCHETRKQDDYVEFSCNCTFCLECIASHPDDIKRIHKNELAEKNHCYNQCWDIGRIIDLMSKYLRQDKAHDEKETLECYILGRMLRQNKFYKWELSERGKAQLESFPIPPFDIEHTPLGNRFYTMACRGVGHIAERVRAKLSTPL